MKNILLVQPVVGEMDSMRDHPTPPMSLLSSATLCQDKCEIRWVDQRISDNWKRDIENAIDSETLCVGTTSYTGPMIIRSLEISEFVKSISHVPVVWGGVHASILPGKTLEDPSIDIVVQGEGEETLAELVTVLSEGGKLNSVKGIWYKDHGRIQTNVKRPFVDLDTLPPLPYHFLPMHLYMPLYQGKKSFFYQSSRGCPYPCTYCYNTVFNNRRWRAKSVRTVERDLTNIIHKYQPEHFYIIDDTFFVDKERSLEIIRSIKELGVTWSLQGVDILSLQGMDDHYIRFLEDAGCTRLTIGIESGSPKIRKLMKKKPYEPESIRNILLKFKESQIILYCSYIAGTPNETEQDLKLTIDLIFNLLDENPRVRNLPIYNYIAYPGTEMFDLAVKESFVPPRTLKEWSLGEWGQILGHSYMDFCSSKSHTPSFYQSLFFVSLFVDNKFSEYSVPLPVKVLSTLYRPLARLRLKRLYFHYFIERHLAEGAMYIWFYLRDIYRSIRKGIGNILVPDHRNVK